MTLDIQVVGDLLDPDTERCSWDWQAFETAVRLTVSAPNKRETTPAESKPAVERRSPGQYRAHVRAATVTEAALLATPIVLTLTAYHSGMLHLRGRLVAEGNAPHLLVLDAAADRDRPERGPHVLVDTRSAAPRAIMVPGITPATSENDPAPVRFGEIRVAGDSPGYLPTKSLISYLRTQSGFNVFGLAGELAVSTLLIEIEQSAESLIHDLASAVFGSFGPPTPGPNHADAYSGVAYSDDDVAHLRAMQRTAADVYGRLEPDRALAWTVEELGEVAQAIRRGESASRLTEELGQLFSWVLCLANICDIDLAAGARSALRHETSRQLSKYGELRPYVPGAISRNRS